jgi:hypothetical protein
MGGHLIPEQIKPLSKAEQKRLEKLEGVIQTNLEGFVSVCLAFAEIKAKRLYRENYLTIEEYASLHFDLSRTRFFQLADGGDLLMHLQECTIVDSGDWQPQNEAQLRPLIPVFKNDPDKLSKIIELAIETAPDGKVTAAHLSKTIKAKSDKDLTKKVIKTKGAIRISKKVSDSFSAAFENLLDEINREIATDWKTTSKDIVLRNLTALQAAIEG